jgi:hypothetical protein
MRRNYSQNYDAQSAAASRVAGFFQYCKENFAIYIFRKIISIT